jgi:hypothetical protein
MQYLLIISHDDLFTPTETLLQRTKGTLGEPRERCEKDTYYRVYSLHTCNSC